MKRIRYLMFVMLCAFLSPLVTKAQCTDQRMAELNKIASNVQVSYNYELTNDNMIYHVELSNITDDIYVVDDEGTIFSTSLYNKDYGDALEEVYTIYSNDANCYGEKLISRNLKLPYFNIYSQLEECKGKLERPECQIWSQSGVNDGEQIISETSKQESVNKLSDGGSNLSIIFVFVFIFVALLLFTIIFMKKIKKK
ncbi:MAG: hypothetical protein IKF01_04040 [Bacilli bacterium]|nr:hypothetical protein [Bacilli bacterium]